MSTISLKSGVHAREWLRIDFQPLEFNFDFELFAEFQQSVKIAGLYIMLKTCSISQKNDSK